MFIACFSYVILNFVDLIIIIALTLLMRIVMSFVWRKFSSVGRQGWYDDMKYGQKFKLGDAHVTPRNIQEVQASKLGDARASPFSSSKYQVNFQCAIFLLLHMLCVILGASLFLFSVLFCFVCCNKWLDPSNICFGEDTLRFNCIEHSSFHSYCSTSVLFLLVLRLALVFHSYFVQSLLVLFSRVWLALRSLLIFIY